MSERFWMMEAIGRFEEYSLGRGSFVLQHCFTLQLLGRGSSRRASTRLEPLASQRKGAERSVITLSSWHQKS